MRRVLIIAALAATLLSPLSASSKDRDERGGGRGRNEGRAEQRQERRYDRGDERRGRGGEYRDRGPRDRQPAYRREDDYDRREPRAQGRDRNPSWRQGEYLPPIYRGSVVRDRERYRLRAPPPGYDWVGVGPDIYLMQRGTGMVLDTIPGGF